MISQTDVLILYVNKTNLPENLEKLDYILSKRRTKQLATIVVSAMPFAYINSIDNFVEITPDIDWSMILKYEDKKENYMIPFK